MSFLDKEVDVFLREEQKRIISLEEQLNGCKLQFLNVMMKSLVIR